MRPSLRFLLALAFIATTTSAATSAMAGDMDPAPERLVLQPPGIPSGPGGAPAFTCQAVAANPEIVLQAKAGQPNDFACAPNNSAFRNLVGELGTAIAPTVMHPARSTGMGGFILALDITFASINADGTSDGGVKYWQQGTRGPTDSNRNQFSQFNASPSSILPIYTLNVRKGLPLGFELGGTLGFVGNTSLWVAGGGLRWAVLEGFRSGFLAYVPDLSIGGGVRTLVGSSKVYITTASLDAVASKPIAIAGTGQVSPFIGYQRLVVFGDSNIVDATPNVDPLKQCGYSGANPQTGAPVCSNKLSNDVDNNSDFNNNLTFNKVTIHRNRLVFGATYRYELLHFGAQFSTDLTSPSGEGNGLTGGAQWAMTLEAGVEF